MPIVGTNVMSYQSQVAVRKSNAAIARSMERLTTGYRINRASDDPAGMAITSKMSAQILSYQRAGQNTSDAIAMLKTVEGALTEVNNLIQRMRELAVQATSGTLTSSDRSALDTEYQSLEAEITRIVTDTKWNSMGILDGTSGSSANGTMVIQVGADSGMSITVALGTMSTASGGTLSDIAGRSVATTGAASTAITKIDLAISDLNIKRATVGAYTNRLESALDNVLSMTQNLTDSRSRVRDADYATELAELARHQIVQQAGVAIMAQANKQPELVLTLLRSL